MTNRPDPEVEWWAAKHEGFLIVAADSAGEVDGYASYTVDERWSGQHADNQVKVGELIACSTEAYAALWSTLISLDMATEVVARYRPVDELLPTSSRRRVASTAATWRTASGCVRSTCWRCLRRAPTGRDRRAWSRSTESGARRPAPTASVTSTDAPADVTMTAAAFGALALGGPGATVLARAGQVAGDAERADALLGWSHAPWSPLQF